MKNINIDINKLFDDVFVHKHILEHWEREQIINLIMIIRDLINSKNDIKKEEYHMGEDKTITFVLNQLLEIYGLEYFSGKFIKN